MLRNAVFFNMTCTLSEGGVVFSEYKEKAASLGGFTASRVSKSVFKSDNIFELGMGHEIRLIHSQSR